MTVYRFGLAKSAGFLRIFKMLPADFPKGVNANLVLSAVAGKFYFNGRCPYFSLFFKNVIPEGFIGNPVLVNSISYRCPIETFGHDKLIKCALGNKPFCFDISRFCQIKRFDPLSPP